MNNHPEPAEPHRRPEAPGAHGRPKPSEIHGRPEASGIHGRSEAPEIHDWPELREIHDGVPPPPGPEIVSAALMRSALMRSALDEAEVAPATPRPYRAWALLAMEARLLHPAIWLASALVMAISVGFVMAKGGYGEFLLTLAAPLIAMAGVAASYGPEHDDAFELVAATPTSPRVILLARLTLVFGYDLALALLASAALALFPLNSAPWGLVPLITTWLGPMAMLAALSLLLSVCWNPSGATSVGLAVWTLYALTTTDLPVPDGFRDFWTTSPATVGLALALTLAAVTAVGTGEPIRRAHTAHRP
ncbi:hypothetical protein [Streptosporangium amethystogenes]|uniref:hypothetical protein n=1 Tax=Streptosporangium amethystogenes TaxID=2002 RepID=UPI0004C529F2|nr:hypothetical protein [Streptosporangium amethystogenes]